MFRLIESICVENGEIPLWEYHLARVSDTRKALFGRPITNDFVSFRQEIQLPPTGKWKLRMVYAMKIEDYSLTPYITRTIQLLKLIHADQLEYSMKWEDRRQLDSLFKQRENADEIIIVKKGNITDTSFSNLAFFDGNRWVTPVNPLLKGVQRFYLLRQGKIQEKVITPDELINYQKISLINALNSLGDIELDISSIIY